MVKLMTNKAIKLIKMKIKGILIVFFKCFATNDTHKSSYVQIFLKLSETSAKLISVVDSS